MSDQPDAQTPAPEVVITPQRVWTTFGSYERGILIPGTEESTEDRIGYTPFPADARIGNVTVALGRTINIGNYNSVKVEVRVSLPGLVEQIEDGSVANHATRLANQFASDLTNGLDL